VLELSVEGKRYVSWRRVSAKTRFRPAHGSLGKSREGTPALGGRPVEKTQSAKTSQSSWPQAPTAKGPQILQYQVDEQGQLQYQKNVELIQSEQNLDGLYLLYIDLEVAQCAKDQVLGNYKSLLAVEDAFCQLAKGFALNIPFWLDQGCRRRSSERYVPGI
jgi:hypothetical protein